MHWTEDNPESFAFELAASFIRFVETEMDARNITQATLAERLGITEGRVSQILNNPGNMTLHSAVKICRALGRKISLVAYDDADEANENGPISPEVFRECWERNGKPRDFFDLETEFDRE